MIDALVTVIKGGVVIYKVACRCNGLYGYLLANKILDTQETNELKAYELAQQLRFGCAECLEVYNAHYSIFKGTAEKHSTSKCKDGFEDPKHAPFKDAVDYTHVVDLDKGTINDRKGGIHVSEI